MKINKKVNNMKKIISFFIITTLAFSLFSQSMEVKSKIDWTKNEFISSISLNLEKAKIERFMGN